MGEFEREKEGTEKMHSNRRMGGGCLCLSRGDTPMGSVLLAGRSEKDAISFLKRVANRDSLVEREGDGERAKW